MQPQHVTRRTTRHRVIAAAAAVAVLLLPVAAMSPATAAASVALPDQIGASEAPADALGGVASRTAIASDELLISQTDGDGSTYTRAQLYSSPTVEYAGGGATMDRRADLRNEYATAAGRFVDDTSERALELRLSATGGPGLLSLSATDGVASSGTGLVDSGGSLVSGATFTLTTADAQALTASLAPVAYFSAPVALAPLESADSGWRQRWAAVETAPGSSVFRLVNKADGLCLYSAAVGQVPTTYPCSGSADVWAYDAGSGRLSQTGTAAAIGTCTPDDDQGFPYFCMVNTNVSSAGQPFSFTLSREFDANDSGGQADPVPSWAVSSGEPSPDADRSFALATGDLDNAVSSAGAYRDEAAVATSIEGQLELFVIDYNSANGSLATTQKSVALPSTTDASVEVAIGDFDGDDRNEIALVYQDSTQNGSPTVQILRYDDQTLTLVSTITNAAGTLAAPLRPDSVTVVAGNFTGRSTGEGQFAGQRTGEGLALSLITNDGQATVAVASFSPDLLTTTSTTLPLGRSTDTTAGVRAKAPTLTAGMFKLDSTHGVTRRELAVRWEKDGLSPGETPSFLTLLDFVTPEDDATLQQPVLRPFGQTEVTDPLIFADPGTVVDAQPYVLTAGGFSGPRTDGIPNLWSIGTVDASDDGGKIPVVYSLSYPNNSTTATIARTPLAGRAIAATDSMWLSVYDGRDDSLRLGAPVTGTLSSITTLKSLVANVPTHSDWNPTTDTFDNISRLGGTQGAEVTVTTDTSNTYTTQVVSTAQTNVTVSAEAAVDASLEIGAGPLATKASIEASVGFGYHRQSASENLDQYQTSITATTASTAIDDDLVQATIQNLQYYRYPILGSQRSINCEAASGTCYQYYEILLPQRMEPVSGFGKTIVDYSPAWQNGNVMSYPTLDKSGDVTAADAGEVQKTTIIAPGSDSPTTSVAGRSLTTLGAGVSSETITLDTEQGQEASTTTENSFSEDEALKITGQYAFFGADGEISLSQKFAAEQVFGSTTLATTTTSSGSEFNATYPFVKGGEEYKVGSLYYFSKAGASTLRHGVDVTSDGLGPYWPATYGTLPDLAFNQPWAAVTDSASQTAYDTIQFQSYPTRQEIRGFDVISPATDDVGAYPLMGNPIAGDQVQFEVELHNYSLTPAPPSTVSFYAVPTTDFKSSNGPTADAQEIPLGSTTTPAIDPQSSVPVLSPTWTTPPQAADTQAQYRIFAVVDEQNEVNEVHELTGQGTCPSIDTTTETALVDPRTGLDETLSCGQNNQGWGRVTVSGTDDDTAQLGVMSTPLDDDDENLTLQRMVLTTGENGVTVDNDAPEPITITVGDTLAGSVHAVSDENDRSARTVLVYQGAPSDRDLVAQTVLHGVAPGAETLADFLWTAQQPGDYDLTAQLLPEDETEQMQTEQIRVHVVAAPGTDIPPTDTPSPTTPTAVASPSPSSAVPGASPTQPGALARTGIAALELLLIAAALLTTGAVLSALRRHRARTQR